MDCAIHRFAIRRRNVCCVALLPLVGRAAASVPVVGVLAPGPPPADRSSGSAFGRLAQGLIELGYVDGKTIKLEYRFDHHQATRLAEQAAELVAMRVRVIVAGHTGSAMVARRMTSTIPIVMAVSADPVADGLVADLARPGGNVTGMSIMSPELTGKRLELLTQALPGIQRVALMLDTSASRWRTELQETEVAATRLKVQLIPLNVVSPQDYLPAFESARRQSAQAMVLMQSPALGMQQAYLASLALSHRMPTISGSTDGQYARAGGLMSFGADIGTSWHASATYVHKILQGTSPAELPVQQPSRFDLAINVQTAAALGLSIPASLLVLANEVVR